MQNAPLIFESQVAPDLFQVRLDLGRLTFLIALRALVEQRVDARLAGFDGAQVDL